MKYIVLLNSLTFKNDVEELDSASQVHIFFRLRAIRIFG